MTERKAGWENKRRACCTMCSRLQIPLGGTYPAAIWTDPRQDEGGQPHSVRLPPFQVPLLPSSCHGSPSTKLCRNWKRRDTVRCSAPGSQPDRQNDAEGWCGSAARPLTERQPAKPISKSTGSCPRPVPFGSRDGIQSQSGRKSSPCPGWPSG